MELKFTNVTPGLGEKLDLPDGSTIEARMEYDDSQGLPWEEADCYGVVSDWRRAPGPGYDQGYKLPGERVLCTDDRNRDARFYDVVATMKKQKEVWGEAVPQCRVCLRTKPALTIDEKNARMNPASMAIHVDATDPRFHEADLETQGEANARAIDDDFEFLRAFCNDRWSYFGVVLKHTTADGYERVVDSLFGIEYGDLCDDDYPTQVANDLLDESGLVDDAQVSTYCGSFTPEELGKHLRDCEVCRADEYLVAQAEGYDPEGDDE